MDPEQGTTGRGRTAQDLLRPPRHALRLLVRYWPVLLAWSLVGVIGFDACMQAAAWLNGWQKVPTAAQSVMALMVVSLGVLIKITIAIAMFYTVRGGLPELDRMRRVREATDAALIEQRGDVPAAKEGEPSFLDVVVVAAIPFITLYVAWDIVERYLNELTIAALQRFEGSPLLGEHVIYGFLAAGALSFLVGWLFRRLETSRLPGRRSWRVLAIYFETAYLFFGVVATIKLVETGLEWLSDRAGWVRGWELVDSWMAALHLSGVMEGIGGVLAELKDPFLYPMVWLAVAAIVYGHLLDRDDTLDARARARRAHRARPGQAERLEAWFQRLPGEARYLVDAFTADPREKWGPVVNAGRLLWHGGPVLVLSYLVMFILVDVGVSWGLIGVTYLIGPVDTVVWLPAYAVLEQLDSVFTGVLWTCLLGAYFDRILGSVSRAGVGPRHAAAPPMPTGSPRR